MDLSPYFQLLDDQKTLPHPAQVYGPRGLVEGTYFVKLIRSSWVDGTNTRMNTVPLWQMEEIMDNGFYAAYLYVRRKKAIGFHRIPEEAQAYDYLQEKWPVQVAALKAYCDTWAHAAVLTPAQVKGHICQLLERFDEALKIFMNPDTQSLRESLPDVMTAYKRLLITLANWAASERVWSETQVESGNAVEGDFLKRRWREDRYKQSYKTLKKVTEYVRSLMSMNYHLESSVPPPRQRKGARRG